MLTVGFLTALNPFSEKPEEVRCLHQVDLSPPPSLNYPPPWPHPSLHPPRPPHAMQLGELRNRSRSPSSRHSWWRASGDPRPPGVLGLRGSSAPAPSPALDRNRQGPCALTSLSSKPTAPQDAPQLQPSTLKMTSMSDVFPVSSRPASLCNL